MKRWTPSEANTRLYYYVIILFLLTVFLRVELIGIFKANFGGTDQNVIYGIQRLLLGDPLYQNPSLPSYAIIQYTPLFYYVTAIVAKIARINAHQVQAIYELTRILNLLFNLASVLLVSRILRNWDVPLQKRITYALPVIMILTTHYYVRIDSLELLLFIAALAAYIRYLKKEKALHLMLAAVLSAACVMTKQNGLLLPGIIGFSLLFQQRRTGAALLYGMACLLAGAFIAWLCCHGDWLSFYRNPYLGLKNGTDFSWLYVIFSSQFYFDLIPCYVTGFLIAWFAFRGTRDRLTRFIGTGAVLSFLFALVTGLKIGSSNNYFTEFLVFVLIGLPLLVQSGFSEKKLFRIGSFTVTIRRFAGIAFVVLISSKTMGLFSALHVEHRMASDERDYRNEQALLRYFTDSLQLKQGEHIYFTNRVFLDNIFIEHSVMPSKDVILQSYTADPHTFDYSTFTSSMNRGRVKYVVMDTSDGGINVRARDEMPFVHFEEDRFPQVARIGAYAVFRYAGQDTLHAKGPGR